MCQCGHSKSYHHNGDGRCKFTDYDTVNDMMMVGEVIMFTPRTVEHPCRCQEYTEGK